MVKMHGLRLFLALTFETMAEIPTSSRYLIVPPALGWSVGPFKDYISADYRPTCYQYFRLVTLFALFIGLLHINPTARLHAFHKCERLQAQANSCQ
jgi:hypothetical protein